MASLYDLQIRHIPPSRVLCSAWYLHIRAQRVLQIFVSRRHHYVAPTFRAARWRLDATT